VKRDANTLQTMNVEIARGSRQEPLTELLRDARKRVGRARAAIEEGQLTDAHAALAALEANLERTAVEVSDDDQRLRAAERIGLTPAELRILNHLHTHLTLAQIAERLFVSRNTVSTQTASVYRKLGVNTRAAAVDEAIHRGLLAV
jgi:LuxR family maltose regulon positive regulatory protein